MVTDPKYTHIGHIVDRSGSMSDRPDGGPSKAENATEGIRQFNAAQAAATPPGERLSVSLHQFDTEHEVVFSFESPADPEVQAYTIWPRYGTALLDAVAFAITRTGETLEKMPEHERPANVYMVISTDGLENSSEEYRGEQGLAKVKDMIAHQRDVYGWKFVFIGADIDAFASSDAMGIASASSLGTSGGAMASAYTVTSNALIRSRGAGGQAVSYSDEEREQAAGH